MYQNFNIVGQQVSQIFKLNEVCKIFRDTKENVIFNASKILHK